MDMRTLAEADPEIADAVRGELNRQNSGLELIASENFVSRAILAAAGSVFTNKYAEGYPGTPLLRRLRVRGRRGKPGDRARQEAVRRRPRQRAAACRRTGEHGGVLRRHEAGRHRPRHEPRARRPPDARPPAELLGPALQGRPVRREARGRAHRLRRARSARRRAQAEDDHGRRERLPARHRLPAHPRGRQAHRRRDGDRHGAHRRPCRRGRPSEPRPALRFRDDDDAQDAAGAAVGHGALHRAVREGPRQGRVSRASGRPARARHRGKGRLLQGRLRAGVCRRISGRSWPMRAGWPDRCRPPGSASSAAEPTTT